MLVKQNVPIKDSEFKHTWNHVEKFGVEQILNRYFEEVCGIKKFSDLVGLPYTSSSSYAMLSNTNAPSDMVAYPPKYTVEVSGTFTEEQIVTTVRFSETNPIHFSIDGLNLSHVGLTQAGSMVLVCENNENEETHYTLEWEFEG